MKKQFRLTISLMIFSIFQTGVNAQISLSQSAINNYVANICGPGITFSNVTLTGSSDAIALFTNGISGGLGATMNSGIVLSTGVVNTSTALNGPASNFISTVVGTAGIPELNTIAGASTNDGIILEFDFVPITNQINVNYQFGSEEYNEYVNSGYNDAFAFFISGPGIVGSVNIATVPGTSIPVTIDNINRGYASGSNCGTGCTNCTYYNDNCSGTFNNAMDGFTKMLTASSTVIPCSTYHIRLMLADGGDYSFDSWVFIQENGLYAAGNPPVSMAASSAVGNLVFAEGCNSNSLVFTIPNALSTPYTFNVTWGGTATPGTDYTPLPTSITIPAGSTSVNIPVNVILDGITEGTETITCTFPASVCDVGFLTISVVDQVPLNVTASNDVTICGTAASTNLTASASGGVGTITYTWNNGAGTGSSVNVSPSATTTYTVTATDQCGTQVSDQVTVNITTFTGLTATPSACNSSTYSVSGQVSFSAAPSTGTLTISSSCGASQTFNAPFSSPISYNLTGLNSNGATCVITASFSAVSCTRTVNYTAPNPTIPTFSPIAVCVGSVAPTLPTTSNNGITGTWSPATISTATAGTTTYTFTPSAGQCATTTTLNVVIRPLPDITIATPPIITCSSPTVQLSASSSFTNLTYTWSGSGITAGGSTSTPTVNQAGTYTVTVTDANNCSSSASIQVNKAPNPSVTASGTTTTCGQNNGTATAIASSGTAPYTYSWSNGASGASINGVASGSITVTVTDAAGCSASANVNIGASTNPTVSVVPTSATCGLSNGSALATANLGIAPYTYSWSSGGANANESNLLAGNYTVTVTDALGCSVVGYVTINDIPSSVSGTITSVNAICTNNNGSITVSPTGGTGSYSFVWSNGATTATASNLLPGNYSVEITDAIGCKGTVSGTVGQTLNTLSLNFSSTSPSCNGSNDGAITANASGGAGPYSYLWNDPTSQTSASASGLVAGNYIVAVTDINGCSAQGTYILTEPDVIAIQVTDIQNVSCSGGNDGAITLSITGGTPSFTYQWDDANSQTVQNPTNLTVGSYTVTVTDGNGCIQQASFNVAQPTLLTSSITLSQAITCNAGNNGALSVTVNGGTAPYSYAWNTGAISNGISGLTVGTYSVTVTDAMGCTSNSSFNLTQPSAVAVNMQTSQNVSCYNGNNGSISVIANGGTAPYTFLWDDPGAQTNNTATGLAAGSYTVIVSDNNGCSTSDTYTITQPTNLMVTQQSVQNVSCYGGNNGTITVSASGGTGPYTYTWNDPNSQTTAIATGLTVGSYMVTVLDANGCSVQGTFQVSEPTVLSVQQVSVQDVLCNGGNDGAIVIAVSGGTPSYSYVWNDPNAQTSQNPTNLAAGSYQVVVTDANGCTTQLTSTVNEPALMSCSISESNAILCNGGNSGVLTATVTGGLPGYTYSWDDPNAQSSAVASNLTAGTYNVQITDNNNCRTSCSYTLSEPSAVTIGVVSSVDVSCKGGADGQITVAATGGTPAYQYQWMGYPTVISDQLGSVPAGTYQALVTDANGCSSTISVTVSEPDTLIASIQINNQVSCFGFSDATAEVIAVGGTPSYSYVWSSNPAQYTNVATGLPAGLIAVTVTDANGCVANATTNISEPSLLTVSIQNPTPNVCPGQPVVLSAIANGGTPGYIFSWQDNETNDQRTFYPTKPTTYSVQVRDQNGCTAQMSNWVNVYPEPIASFNYSPNEISDLEPLVSFENTSTGAVQYVWSFGDGKNSTLEHPDNLYPSEPGEYTVLLEVINEYGCKDQTTQEIRIISDFIIYIPNSFTPNGDKTNDVFKIKGRGVQEITMSIFTRWGQELIRLEGDQPITIGWDGTFDNEVVQQGIYVYLIEVVDTKGKYHKFTGNVNLIR